MTIDENEGLCSAQLHGGANSSDTKSESKQIVAETRLQGGLRASSTVTPKTTNTPKHRSARANSLGQHFKLSFVLLFLVLRYPLFMAIWMEPIY